MNGIFGLLSLDGAPVPAEQLAVMQQALAFWAADRAEQWRSGRIGMGCLHQAGTAEAVNEQLPRHDAASELTLTAGARLDNRDELLNHLKIAAGRDRAAVTDSEIILRAYQQWGRDCVHYLDGDWHFVIWDERSRSLFLARDHHGNSGLYYYHDPHFFAFASSKKALLALDGIPKAPDLLRISQVLTSWPGEGIRTAYEQILRLPPAHRLLVTADGVNAERYWFPENVSELKLKSDDAYVEAFMEVFTQAVSARLRSQNSFGATLSGGLDSSTVMAVAAGMLQEREKSLIAYTAAPLSDPGPYTNPGRFGDETQLAAAVAHYAGDIEHHLVKAKSVTPLDGIRRMLWLNDEPGHAAANQFWVVALLEAARAQGIGVLLTGQMGNASISWTGGEESLLPMLRSGDVAGFWRAFEAARRDAKLGRWRGARRYILRPLLWPLWPLWFEVQKRRRVDIEEWLRYSPIRSDFVRTINLRKYMAEDGFFPDLTPVDPFQRRMRILRPGENTGGAKWFEAGGLYGLDVRDPTQDRRVIELCLAIPRDQFQRSGVDRWLIRRAMQGYLPDAVRLNTGRGLQAADLGQRVLNDRVKIEAALADLEQNDLCRQILDLPRMANVLASLEDGLTAQNTAECATILFRGLMAGLFLLRF